MYIFTCVQSFAPRLERRRSEPRGGRMPRRGRRRAAIIIATTIYIYIYIHRERERDRYMYISISLMSITIIIAITVNTNSYGKTYSIINDSYGYNHSYES